MNEISNCIIFIKSQKQKSRHTVDYIQKIMLKFILNKRMLKVCCLFKSFKIADSHDDTQRLS